ncbi:hypothetical protein GCM10007235_01110 [Pseudoxanthomonas indica]|nr:hypothetical protein GCM10007235_01110 [Pseudoxanthomonas indica]
MMAIMKDRPSVNGTNRKWYMAVSANCKRDSSTTVISGMALIRQRSTGVILVSDGGGMGRHSVAYRISAPASDHLASRGGSGDGEID